MAISDFRFWISDLMPSVFSVPLCETIREEVSDISKNCKLKTINFLWDNWNIISETAVSPIPNSSLLITNSVSYVWGVDLSGSLQGAGGVGGLLTVIRDDGVFTPTYDANGNVSEYIASDGTIAAHYEYDAFGNTVVQSGDLADSFSYRFSTKLYDSITSLLLYQFRPDSVSLGRWITRDPMEEEGGWNLYGFCENEGIGKIDYFGLRITKEVQDNPIIVSSISGGHRATTIASGFASVTFSCSGNSSSRSSCLSINGELKLKIEILGRSDNAWNTHLPRYDKQWGKPRLNPVERNAALAHEQDHFRTYKRAIDLILGLNTFDGKRCSGYEECETKRKDLENKYTRLVSEMDAHSNSFDWEDRNMGNRYTFHPFTPTVTFD